MSLDDHILTWIHVSDLHIEQEDRFNRNVVLEALWQDIGGFVSRGFRPDFVAFTGDVAYHGFSEEYELATEEFFDPLLAAANVGKDHLFVIPGNHDVNRKRTNRLKSPIEDIRTEDDIRRLLEDTDEWDSLLSPFSNFLDFADSYLPACEGSESVVFAHSHRIKKGDFEVAVVGMNSAWLCGFHRGADGEVDDRGRLAIGEVQARAVLPTAAHLTIVLVHHPFCWLLEADQTAIEDFLAKHSLVVLGGHLHRSNVVATSSIAGNLLVIPCGAVFDGRKSPNAYNLVQVDLKAKTGVVYLRRYNHQRDEWQRDIQSTGEERDGQFMFTLPTRGQEGTVGVELRVSDYDLVFTDDCRRDMTHLELAEQDVLDLVQGEFRSHLNYFKYDLEDYPLPVRTSYIIYLDKVEQRIEFRRIVPCTENEAKLSSWSGILMVYRRATRMGYRRDPTQLLSVKGMVGEAVSLHLGIKTRIEKHYEQFGGIIVHPGLRQVAEFLGTRGSHSGDAVPARTESPDRMGDEIAYHLLESHSACEEALEAVEAMKSGYIDSNAAIGLIVTAFERSLQHLHKIILRYPPVADGLDQTERED